MEKKSKKQSVTVIDPLDLRTIMLRNGISLTMVKNQIKPRVSLQAVHKALRGKSKPLLYKIDLAIKELLTENK